MKPLWLRLFLTIAMLMAAVGCGQSQDPLPGIRSDLGKKGIDTYSIMLADMQEEGNFFKTYYHTYRVVAPEKDLSDTFGPIEVPKKMFDRYKPYLGMTIWAQRDGKVNESAAPPGYAYVGDPRYGQWRSDSSGRSFWVFYGQYRMLSDLLGVGGRLFRDDYDDYRGYRSKNRPYYGPNQRYGTSGAFTRKQYPDFFQRHQAKARVSSSTFADKVNKRIGRTRTSVRGRGFSGGK
ncbi:MAG: hypothetical protein PVI90_15170 [Desulfobacteraceae bacterium]|jgi:hypothetical protein